MPPPATCKAYTDRYDPCGELEFGQSEGVAIEFGQSEGGYPSPGAVKGLPGPVLHLLRPQVLRFCCLWVTRLRQRVLWTSHVLPLGSLAGAYTYRDHT